MLRFALKSGLFLLIATALLCGQEPPQQTTPQQIQGRRPQVQPHQAPLAAPTPDGTQPQATQQTPQQQASPQQVPQAQPTLVNGVPVNATPPRTAVGKNHKTQKPAAEIPQEKAQAPVKPPKPPTLEQSPATPPQVSYTDGMLSIVSRNSTLGDILTSVRKLTGAAIDAPSTTLSERVATSLGPAPPKDVLASLFNGSRFDYIILGSMKNPGGVDRIILTAKQSGAVAPTGPATAQANPGQPVRTVQNAPIPEPPETESEDDNNTPEREQAEEPPMGPPEQPGAGQVQPGLNGQPGQPVQPGQPGAVVPQGVQQPGVQPAPDGSTPNADQSQNPQQPKSPEQLLRELQEMQRQKQNDQQNNDQNPR